jgi:hypothetical protein
MKEFIYKSVLGFIGICHIYYSYWFLTIHNKIKEGLKFTGIPKEDTT